MQQINVLNITASQLLHRIKEVLGDKEKLLTRVKLINSMLQAMGARLDQRISTHTVKYALPENVERLVKPSLETFIILQNELRAKNDGYIQTVDKAVQLHTHRRMVMLGRGKKNFPPQPYEATTAYLLGFIKKHKIHPLLAFPIYDAPVAGPIVESGSQGSDSDFVQSVPASSRVGMLIAASLPTRHKGW